MTFVFMPNLPFIVIRSNCLIWPSSSSWIFRTFNKHDWIKGPDGDGHVVRRRSMISENGNLLNKEARIKRVALLDKLFGFECVLQVQLDEQEIRIICIGPDLSEQMQRQILDCVVSLLAEGDDPVKIIEARRIIVDGLNFDMPLNPEGGLMYEDFFKGLARRWLVNALPIK